MTDQPSRGARVTSRPGRRERRAAETRERIFRAAIELFAERGLANVTVEQITERADVGKGTFFNYFQNKEAVLTYFGGVQVARLEHALEKEEIRGSPQERVNQILEMLAAHPLLTPDLARAMFISALSTTPIPEIQGPTIWQIEGVLADIIREGQEVGEFRRDHTADTIARFINGQYFLAMLSWCAGFEEQGLVETVRHFVTLGLDCLASRS
jgi:TetR/AcrR family transcriptional regulator, cholesterol catabolism regulator